MTYPEWQCAECDRVASTGDGVYCFFHIPEDSQDLLPAERELLDGGAVRALQQADEADRAQLTDSSAEAGDGVPSSVGGDGDGAGPALRASEVGAAAELEGSGFDWGGTEGIEQLSAVVDELIGLGRLDVAMRLALDAAKAMQLRSGELLQQAGEAWELMSTLCAMDAEERER